MDEYDDVVVGALAAVARYQAQAATETIVLSNGIVLRPRRVPPGAIHRAMRAIPDPPVPTIWIEDKERHEENPADPDYLDEVNRMHLARLAAYQRLLLTLGTTVESVPDGVYGPKDDGWVDGLRAAGVEPNVDNAMARHADWLELYALADPADVMAVHVACMAATAVFDREVLDAIQFFRNRTLRGTDNLVPATADA